MKRILVFLTLFLYLGLSGQKKPVVYILATGGTIAGSGDSEISSTYKAGTVGVDLLINSVPSLVGLADIKGEQVMQIASQNITTKDWIKLARRIQEIVDQKEVKGVVITHGTDTMEESAYFLNLVVNTKKPIIFVGAMRPSNGISADGPKNLYNAVACAISDESLDKGVMILMNDKIFGADDVTKMHTINVDAFQDPNYGPLGYMYGGKPIFSRSPLKKHTNHSQFNVKSLKKGLPYVEIVYGYGGADAAIINFILKNKVKGIVYAGVGNGNFPDSVLYALDKARKKGVAIVRSSRIVMGPTSQWDEIDDDKYNFATSWNLNPQKSRILLMLALTQTNNYKDIQKLFLEY